MQSLFRSNVMVGQIYMQRLLSSESLILVQTGTDTAHNNGRSGWVHFYTRDELCRREKVANIEALQKKQQLKDPIIM